VAIHGAIRQPVNASGVLELTILRFIDGWKILCGGRRWGRFESRVDAEEAALTLHARARDIGVDARIVVQEASGELRIVTPQEAERDVVHG
jgi:hypothetical protein